MSTNTAQHSCCTEEATGALLDAWDTGAGTGDEEQEGPGVCGLRPCVLSSWLGCALHRCDTMRPLRASSHCGAEELRG